jgi:hypothetical protein
MLIALKVVAALMVAAAITTAIAFSGGFACIILPTVLPFVLSGLAKVLAYGEVLTNTAQKLCHNSVVEAAQNTKNTISALKHLPTSQNSKTKRDPGSSPEEYNKKYGPGRT